MMGIPRSVYNFSLRVVVLTLIISTLCVKVNTSELSNVDSCELPNGNKNGLCIDVLLCPSAIQGIFEGRKPIRCGANQSQDLICCEQPAIVEKRRVVGDISRKKCDVFSSPYDQPSITLGQGGVNAQPKEFTHMAALGYGDPSNITWGCGGSLISDFFVLTAAHCVETTSLGRVKMVRLGDLNLHLKNESADPKDYNVSDIFVHPEYIPPSVYNDIALIRLEHRVEYTKYILPGCLQTHFDIDTDREWSATGWGVTSYYGPMADHLQQMILRESPFEECHKVFLSTGRRRLRNGIDNRTQLCAGNYRVDTCQGDSGGPLQIRNPRGKIGYTIIGVTSFGKPCGLTKAPGVYTRVSHYIEWIESIVWPQ